MDAMLAHICAIICSRSARYFCLSCDPQHNTTLFRSPTMRPSSSISANDVGVGTFGPNHDGSSTWAKARHACDYRQTNEPDLPLAVVYRRYAGSNLREGNKDRPRVQSHHICSARLIHNAGLNQGMNQSPYNPLQSADISVQQSDPFAQVEVKSKIFDAIHSMVGYFVEWMSINVRDFSCCSLRVRVCDLSCR
jgi:hypothetical protein